MNPEEKILSVLSKLSGISPENIHPQMELVSELNIDSAKALELLVELEEIFEVELSDEDAAQMETVEDILQRFRNPPLQ